MIRKGKLIYLIGFLIGCLVFLFIPNTSHALEWKVCYYTPIPMKNGAVDWAQVEKEVLNIHNPPIQKSLNGLPLNLHLLYKRHLVVYGNPSGTIDYKNTVCGDPGYRYLGYAENGTPISDPFFRADFTATDHHTVEAPWLSYPWANWNVLTKWKSGNTEMPQPIKDNYYATDAERAADLNRAIDVFAPGVNGGRGDFINPQWRWCKNTDGTGKLFEVGVSNGKCGQYGRPPGQVFDGQQLAKFAVIHNRPTTFAPGYFTMYSKTVVGYCGYMNICYSTYYIPPLEDPFVPTKLPNDVRIELSIPKTTYTDEAVTGKITIYNDWNKETPLYVESPCDNTGYPTKAQCSGAGRNGGIFIYFPDGSYKSKIFTFPEIGQGKSTIVEFDLTDIMPEESGDYVLAVDTQYYADHNGEVEPNTKNNSAQKAFTYNVQQNAFVSIAGSNSYSIADTLSNEVTVYNNMKKPISGEVNISILDADGQVIKSPGSFAYSDIPVNKYKTFNLSEFGLSLDVGNYSIKAEIQKYNGEKNYDDNVAIAPISVGAFVPGNTKCKTIETQYTNVLEYNGKKPGITRSCIGWTPNYPSTRVEGGQGTYFYFAYKLFPTPMPAYEVTTSDDLGLFQSFSLSEPKENLGACDLRANGGDSDCEMYEPYLYYPAKWEDRFRTDTSLSDFKGPYTVGPHEFYHYRYRGRLVPQQVTFHYNIIDMQGKQNNIPLAFGEIVYDVPDECYYEEIIEIKEECRTIQFYVPTDGKDSLKLSEDALNEDIPEERIRFYNPGEHTFRVEVDEKQMYLYQTDDGVEWQGKKQVLREPLPEEKITGEPMTKEVFVYRYWEGIYSKGEKANPQNGFLGEGGWCGTSNGAGCAGSLDPSRKMTTSMEYEDEDGYRGTLTPNYVNQLSGRNFYHKLEDSSMWKAYVPRQMTDVGKGCWTNLPNYCDNVGQGYDYRWRTFFTDANGNVTKRSPWQLTQTLFEEITSTFPGWPANYRITDKGFTGTEWQRYQVVGGIVKKDATLDKDGDGYDDNANGSKYPMGPVITHKTEILDSGEIEWVNREDYKNHCYSEENAFSDYGTWEQAKSKFTEEKNPAIVCYHNHSDDFHYWEFDWSPVKKFGGDDRNGLIY